MGNTLIFILFSAFFSPVDAADFGKEITATLRQAEVAHQNATSYQEWTESQFHPEALAENFKIKAARKGYNQSLCQVLQKTPSPNLYYLIDYLEQTTVPCLLRQKNRYQQFLQFEQAKISSQFYTTFNLAQPKTLGPSQEVWIDAVQTPVIIDAGLPAKTLALTFDDGPHTTRTAELLKLLAEENLQVNFFLVGRNTILYPDLVKQENDAGHEVGCHSYTHADLRKLKLESAIAEIEDGFSAIQKAIGEPRTMFRFPYGAYTNSLRNYLIKSETPEFLWNIDTLDWKYKDPSFLIDYALNQVRREGRGVVLFHDIQPQTLAIMPGFLAALKNEGYKIAVLRPTKTRKHPKSLQ